MHMRERSEQLGFKHLRHFVMEPMERHLCDGTPPLTNLSAHMTRLLDYRCVGPASLFPVEINAIEISEDGSLVGVADSKRNLMIFGLEDLASGAAASINVDCSAEIHSLAWSGSSSRIFSGLSNGTLTVATITPVSGSSGVLAQIHLTTLPIRINFL
jgi:hypothetical protein